MKEYDKKAIETQLSTLMLNLEKISLESKQIDASSINDVIKETNKLVTILSNKDLEISSDQYSHFILSSKLLKEMLEIQKDMIDIAISKIDPNPEGYISSLYHKIYKIKKNTLDPDDANILWNILKAISKPFSYIMDIFESITPDKWRIASNWEKIKLVMGLSLTLLGVAFIIAAIVLTVVSPIGAGLATAVVGGIGLTLSVNGFGFGIAAFFSCTFGGIFLRVTSNTLSKKLNKKQEFEKMKKECDTAIQQLDNQINPTKKNISEHTVTSQPNIVLTFSQNLQAPATEELSFIQLAVSSLKKKLSPTSGNV